MLKQNTHFEQVPLEVVEKILKQAGAQIASALAQTTAEQTLEAQEPVARTLGARRKNPALIRGKQVRYQAR
jgi:hypothetical protein